MLDWNAPSIGFYEALGARLMDDWTICRVTGDALDRLAARLSAEPRRPYARRCDNRRLPNSTRRGHRTPPPAVPATPRRRCRWSMPAPIRCPSTVPFPIFASRADFWSLRFVGETCESYAVRKDVPQPFGVAEDVGVMATVYADGGYGYAATADLSPAGLRDALERAAQWARATAPLALFDARTLPRPAPRGRYASPGGRRAATLSRREWFELLMQESRDAGDRPAHRRLGGGRATCAPRRTGS